MDKSGGEIFLAVYCPPAKSMPPPAVAARCAPESVISELSEGADREAGRRLLEGITLDPSLQKRCHKVGVDGGGDILGENLWLGVLCVLLQNMEHVRLLARLIIHRVSPLRRTRGRIRVAVANAHGDKCEFDLQDDAVNQLDHVVDQLARIAKLTRSKSKKNK